MFIKLNKTKKIHLTYLSWASHDSSIATSELTIGCPGPGLIGMKAYVFQTQLSLFTFLDKTYLRLDRGNSSYQLKS